ncbi:MAG: hypothetical protein LAO55_24915 [Acidobacteriia bacterium]|nr:hypothetical protein [Terriglobia bacterium]
MRPGNFSQTGFLGPDESLRQVLDTDARALDELGVSAHMMAQQLGELLEAALASKNTATRVGHYDVRVQRYKGPQICPFAPNPHENPCPGAGGMRLASIDWDIRNTRNRVRLSGPGLIVHLIDAHTFFEGLQSPYRVAPHALAELLELGPFSPPSR